MCSSTHARPSDVTCSAVVTENQSRSGSPSTKKPFWFTPRNRRLHDVGEGVDGLVKRRFGHQRGEARMVRFARGEDSQGPTVETSHVGEKSAGGRGGVSGDWTGHHVQE